MKHMKNHQNVSTSPSNGIKLIHTIWIKQIISKLNLSADMWTICRYKSANPRQGLREKKWPQPKNANPQRSSQPKNPTNPTDNYPSPTTQNPNRVIINSLTMFQRVEIVRFPLHSTNLLKGMRPLAHGSRQAARAGRWPNWFPRRNGLSSPPAQPRLNVLANNQNSRK